MLTKRFKVFRIWPISESNALVLLHRTVKYDSVRSSFFPRIRIKREGLKFFVFVFFLALLFLPGCIVNIRRSSSNGGTPAGILKSFDKGKSWVQKSLVPTTSGKPLSLQGVNIRDIALDPQDPLALYIATPNNGLWYSYDGAENWFPAGSLKITSVNAVAVDPLVKCTIYVASGREIWKSIDCNRSWEVVYTDSRGNIEIKNLAIEKDHRSIYAGTSAGDLLLSLDEGKSWQTPYRFPRSIQQIVIDPRATEKIYVVMDRGIFRSTDRGKNWTDLTKTFDPFDRAKGTRSLFLDLTTPETLYVIMKFGIVKSTNAGETWEALPLLTPPGGVVVRGFAINPKDGKEIYYSVDNAVYRTLDGGAHWEVDRIPSGAIITRLQIDPNNSSILYGSLYVIEKKR